MTARRIPINFGKIHFSTVFDLRGNPRQCIFSLKFKISNSIASVNSQYFLTGPVLNEIYCNFAHNYCRRVFGFDPGGWVIPQMRA